MKKTSPRKLQLSSETLRRLSNERLAQVAGGRRSNGSGTDSTAGEHSSPETSCVACSGPCGGSPTPN